MSEVSRFWNEQADDYQAQQLRDWVERSHLRVAADLLNAEVAGGRVLCVGGPWVAADPELDLTVVDVSARMLSKYAEAGMRPVLGDARRLPVADGSFDHAVVPLVLHHITGDGGRAARVNARAAVRAVSRALGPGGRLWIQEIVVPPPIYALELAFARVTRALLGLKGIPLVVFHSDRFLRRSLVGAGLTEVRSIVTDSPGERWHDWIQPVIGLPRLRVPRLVVPVGYRLIVGTQPVA